MPAGAQVITKAPADRRADGRLRPFAQTRLSEHVVDGIGMHGPEEFAEGV
ncbi:MAG: hypothetical protein RIS38_790, partial [Verrucomicrobiota bacterium]